jgi:hypothetical protein
MPERPTIQVFLSHRYKSPEVNQYFFEVFDDVAEVQFEVDVGRFATCVTRLERMVRNAEAFLGLYPLAVSRELTPGEAELREASQYFRLELDLALRSGRPALVFHDHRFGPWLRCPGSVGNHVFDLQELLSRGGKPKRARHREVFARFVAEAQAHAVYQNSRTATPPEVNRVGIWLPKDGKEYTEEARSAVASALEAQGCEVIQLPWPPVLAAKPMAELERLDWVLTDLGDAMVRTGMPAFLHARFVPMIRCLHGDEESRSPLEAGLLGAFEVGYPKDIVRWQNPTQLIDGVLKRLQLLREPVRRISTLSEAEEYFGSAALRKEAVFLSYSGKDQDLAAAIATELKKRFRTVFNYRDGESIAAGQNWQEEIFGKLAGSAIGIALLSPDYLASGYCRHEADVMFAQRDAQKMTVLPIKIRNQELELPPWATSVQYLRYWEYPDAAGVVEALSKFYDQTVVKSASVVSGKVMG